MNTEPDAAASALRCQRATEIAELLPNAAQQFMLELGSPPARGRRLVRGRTQESLLRLLAGHYDQDPEPLIMMAYRRDGFLVETTYLGELVRAVLGGLTLI